MINDHVLGTLGMQKEQVLNSCTKVYTNFLNKMDVHNPAVVQSHSLIVVHSSIGFSFLILLKDCYSKGPLL